MQVEFWDRERRKRVESNIMEKCDCYDETGKHVGTVVYLADTLTLPVPTGLAPEMCGQMPLDQSSRAAMVLPYTASSDPVAISAHSWMLPPNANERDFAAFSLSMPAALRRQKMSGKKMSGKEDVRFITEDVSYSNKYCISTRPPTGLNKKEKHNDFAQSTI